MSVATINHRRWCGAMRCEVSLRIYEILRQKGLTGKDVAEQIGVSRQSVSQVINGVSHSPKILETLRLLGVPEQYLFDPQKNDFQQENKKIVA
ncbi:helix-turn-helix domain-containing protein [Helicobacter japonicus]|uniref:helix-turn-helix domain-containing protein n=1 Tax=Helicobacter japonicus TaxID=425400 RepID=UPI0032206DFA